MRNMFLVSSSDLHGISQAIAMTHAAKAGKQGSVKVTKHIGTIKTKPILKWQTEHKGTH